MVTSFPPSLIVNVQKDIVQVGKRGGQDQDVGKWHVLMLLKGCCMSFVTEAAEARATATIGTKQQSQWTMHGGTNHASSMLSYCPVNRTVRHLGGGYISCMKQCKTPNSVLVRTYSQKNESSLHVIPFRHSSTNTGHLLSFMDHPQFPNCVLLDACDDLLIVLSVDTL